MDTQHNKPCSLFLSLTANPTAEMKAQQDALVSMTADLMDQVNPYDFKDDVDQLNYQVNYEVESDGVQHLHNLFINEMLEMYPMYPEYYKRGAAAVGNITAVLEDCRPEVFTLIKHAVPAAILHSVPRVKLTVAQCKAFVEERIDFVDYLITERKKTPAEAIFDALAAAWATDNVDGTVAQMIDEAVFNAPAFNAPRYEAALEIATLRADVARLNATVATLNEVIQSLTAR